MRWISVQLIYCKQEAFSRTWKEFKLYNFNKGTWTCKTFVLLLFYTTIALWFPCKNSLIQANTTECRFARVRKNMQGDSPKQFVFRLLFLILSRILGSGHTGLWKSILWDFTSEVAELQIGTLDFIKIWMRIFAHYVCVVQVGSDSPLLWFLTAWS